MTSTSAARKDQSVGSFTALSEIEQATFGAPRSTGPYGPEEFAELRAKLNALEGRSDAPAQAAAPDRVTAAVTGRGRRRNTTPKSPFRRALEGAQPMTEATPQAAASNLPSFETYLEEAKELGRLAGQGKNTGFTMLLKLLEGAYLGTLSFEPRQGKEEGDHAELAAAYASAQGLTNMNDAKAGNMRKLKSDFGVALRVGSDPRFGLHQPTGITNDLVTKWRSLRNKRVEGLMDAYNMCLRFWRAIAREDTLPNEAELSGFCYKPQARPASGEAVVRRCLKELQALSQGKLKNCADMDDSKEVKDAVASLNKRALTLAKIKEAVKPPKMPKQPKATAAAAAAV